MDAFRIEGGQRLSGRVAVNGSKNASLPLMAGAILADGPVQLRGVPVLRDISNMQKLLDTLGVESTRSEDGNDMTLRVFDDSLSHARYEIVSTMRAGICVLGPLLARRGRARVSMPGGCAIGERPVDLHLRGLEALGVRFHLEGGDIVGTVDRLRGATIFLGGPFGSTVLGTANVMSAAVLAEGVTIIESAACEPEILDLATMLNAMGAKIQGAGTPRITIEGVKRLHGADHTVMPDRIEAGTYIIAAAITNGDVIVENCPYDCLLAVFDRLQQIGVNVDLLPNGHAGPAVDLARTPYQQHRCAVKVSSARRLQPVSVTTQPYPGFPTDLQAQLLTLLCLADGNSVVTEKIYPERFLHVAELGRMGARLFRQGPTVIVTGVNRLVGAQVMASDLRASASLVLAGLAAEGTTIVNRVYHLDRGYERMEEHLGRLGAKIERFDPDKSPR